MFELRNLDITPTYCTTRTSGENVKGRRLLFASDAFRRIAGSFRRVLLGPKRRWQQYAGMRRPPCGKSYERPESLQNIAECYFNVEQEKTGELATYCGLLFQRQPRLPLRSTPDGRNGEAAATSVEIRPGSAKRN